MSIDDAASWRRRHIATLLAAGHRCEKLFGGAAKLFSFHSTQQSEVSVPRFQGLYTMAAMKMWVRPSKSGSWPHRARDWSTAAEHWQGAATSAGNTAGAQSGPAAGDIRACRAGATPHWQGRDRRG